MGGEGTDKSVARNFEDIDKLQANILLLLTDKNTEGLLFLHLIFAGVMDWEDADILFDDVTYADRPQTICRWIINYIKNESKDMSDICYKQVKEWIKDQMCNPN
jgi:hypothetical protein